MKKHIVESGAQPTLIVDKPNGRNTKTLILEPDDPTTVIVDELGPKEMNTFVLDPGAPPIEIVDALDPEHPLPRNGSPLIVLPPLRPAPPEPSEHETQNVSRVLNHLLSMGDSYRETGFVHSAIEIYFELIHKHAETTQANRAEERLFEVARSYEMAGELRQARGIYEQLL